MAPPKGLTRQSIYDAALALAEQEGYDRLGIQPLAKRLGVKAASLYNHISGLEELREYLSCLSMLELSRAIEEAARGKARERALGAMALAYRDFARQRPELYRAFIGSARLTSANVREARQALGNTVTAQLSAYKLEKEELTHFSRAFRSALHGFVALEDAGFFQQKASVDDSFSMMLKGHLLLLESISGRGENQ